MPFGEFSRQLEEPRAKGWTGVPGEGRLMSSLPFGWHSQTVRFAARRMGLPDGKYLLVN